MQRQREAVGRASCRDAQRRSRAGKRVTASALVGRSLWVDGYNVLTTVEAALAGGVLLSCRDGEVRDMASMHGSWRRVEETVEALERIGSALRGLGLAELRLLFDAPVSNSGRLRCLVEETLPDASVELVRDPDRDLVEASTRCERSIVATADSAVLDACGASFSLASHVVDFERSWVLPLGG